MDDPVITIAGEVAGYMSTALHGRKPIREPAIVHLIKIVSEDTIAAAEFRRRVRAGCLDDYLEQMYPRRRRPLPPHKETMG